MFFGELEVSGAQDLFRRFNVGQLPYVFRLAPSLSLAGSGNVKLPPDDVLKVEHVGHYPFLAGDFAHFVRGTTLGSGCTCDPAAGMPSLPRWEAACHAAIHWHPGSAAAERWEPGGRADCARHAADHWQVVCCASPQCRSEPLLKGCQPSSENCIAART